jgi:hypothetical protein
MDTQSYFISLSPEVKELLADNGLDLIEELKKEIPEIQKDNRSDPTIGDHNRTREITLIILAGTAAVYGISMAIERIINALGNKPSKVTNTKIVPVLDGKGDVVRDKNGEPILHWVEEAELLEVKNKTIDQGKATISGFGLKVELQNKNAKG